MTALHNRAKAIISSMALLAVSCAPAMPQQAPAPATAPTAPAAAPAPAAGAQPTQAPRAATAPPATPAPTPRPASAQPAPAQPKYGGTLNLIRSTDPPNLDIHFTSTAFARQGAGLVYSKLLINDFGTGVDPDKLVVVPDLAEKWEQPNGTTYIFHLRKDAKWQSLPPANGRPVTAQDVKYSFERMKSPDSVFKENFDLVKNIDVVDAQTVKFTLAKPFAPFINLVAFQGSAVVAREVVDADGDLKKTAIGSGPWILSEFNRGVRQVYSKNPTYFNKDKIYLDKIIYYVIPDTATQLAAFRAQRADLWAFPKDQIDILKSAIPGLQTEALIARNVNSLGFAVDKPPFNDIRVRRAFSLALDRQAIIQFALAGDGIVQGPIPRGYLTAFGLKTDDASRLGTWWKYDPAQAKKLLEEAGYKDGLKLKGLGPNNLPNLRDNLIGSLDQLKAVGITLQPEVVQFAIFNERKFKRDFDVLSASFSSTFDVDQLVYVAYHSTGSQNVYGIKDPKLDDLLERQRTAILPEDRAKAIGELNQYLMDQVYLPTTYDQVNWWAWQPYVRGVRPQYYWTAASGEQRWEGAWLAK